MGSQLQLLKRVSDGIPIVTGMLNSPPVSLRYAIPLVTHPDNVRVSPKRIFLQPYPAPFLSREFALTSIAAKANGGASFDDVATEATAVPSFVVWGCFGGRGGKHLSLRYGVRMGKSFSDNILQIDSMHSKPARYPIVS